MKSNRTPRRGSTELAEVQDAEEDAEVRLCAISGRFSLCLCVSAFIFLFQLTGCAATPNRPIATTDPSLVLFESREMGMRFSYPKAWHPVKDDTILSLVPAGEDTLRVNHLVIDNPDVPFHIPFVIPMGPVVSGFEDDVKKRYKEVTEEPVRDRIVAGVAGKEVNARARSDSGEVVVRAVLLVRGDHVFVIDVESEAAKAADAMAAFETVVESLQWIN